MQLLCIVLTNAIAEQVFSHKYVDPNCSKTLALLPRREGCKLLASHQNSECDFSLKMVWSRRCYFCAFRSSLQGFVIPYISGHSCVKEYNQNIISSCGLTRCAHTHTHTEICHTNCFFTATIVSPATFNVTLYVFCLSCFFTFRHT